MSATVHLHFTVNAHVHQWVLFFPVLVIIGSTGNFILQVTKLPRKTLCYIMAKTCGGVLQGSNYSNSLSKVLLGNGIGAP